jgi:hypothetical protein
MKSVIVTDSTKLITYFGEKLRIVYKPDDLTRFPRSEFSRPKPADYLKQLAGTNVKTVFTNIDFTESDFESIPSNLEELHLEHGEPLTENTYSITTSSPVRIPSTLKRLTVRKPYSGSWIKALPQTLEELSMNRSWHFDKSHYELLPRDLKRLSITGIQTDIQPSLNVDLPPNLENFSLDSQTIIKDDLIAKLPRTLKHLTLGSQTYNYVTPNGLKNLPENLLSLNMSFEKNAFPVDGPWNLPQNLRELTIRSDGTPFSRDLTSGPRMVLGNMINYLPPNIQTLNLASNVSISMQTLLEHDLPANLRTVNISISYAKHKTDTDDDIAKTYAKLVDKFSHRFVAMNMQIVPEDMYIWEPIAKIEWFLQKSLHTGIRFKPNPLL